MIDKRVKNAAEAVKDIETGMTVMFGGFGLCGIPENCIAELVNKNIGQLPASPTMPVWMTLGWACFCIRNRSKK